MSEIDIAEALAICDTFVSNMDSIDQQAASDEQQLAATAGENGAHTSPSRDPQRAFLFLVQLFGFLAAVRTAKEYIDSLVARTPGETIIRDRLAKSHLVQFHAEMANGVLHRSIVRTARKYFKGGPKDNAFSYIYNADAMDKAAAPFFRIIQDARNKATGELYSIIDLAKLVHAEMQTIDADCRVNNYYRSVAPSSSPTSHDSALRTSEACIRAPDAP